MKHLFRFYGKQVSDRRWEIAADESQHLAKVLRLNAGDTIEVFDGAGRYAVGVIQTISKKSTIVETPETLKLDQEKPKLIVCLGALKPASMDKVLAPLVELGVDKLVVYLQGQTQKSRIQTKVLERWNRIILSSCKQSKRNFLPEVVVYSNLEEALNHECDSLSQDLFKAQFSESGLAFPFDKSAKDYFNLFYVVGSEAGFSDLEMKLLKDRNFFQISLSINILTAYTATIAATALLTSWREVSMRSD